MKTPLLPLVLLFWTLLSPVLVLGAVQVGKSPETATTLDEVYVVEGIPYLSIDDVLAALEAKGQWDSVSHRYLIRTPGGEIDFFPGGRYLNRAGRYIPLKYPARFIDGRLRVPEPFVTSLLPGLLETPLHYRNLAPPRRVVEEEGTVDRLFSFILRRKSPASGPALRAIAVDPGHGGEDTGVLAPGGVKEKDVVLAIARRLEKQLKMQSGIPVYLSRTGDYDVAPADRLAVARRDDVDVLLLLHAQSSFSPDHQGLSLYVRPEESSPAAEEAGVELPRPRESLRLAHSLLAAFRRAGFVVNGVQETALLPLGQGDLPTVLIEFGYLSHAGEREGLLAPETQERMAAALSQGVKSFAELGREMGIR